MNGFTGKVAVITGAASGIGSALAQKSAALGMKVVLADVEELALMQLEVNLKASGTEVLAVKTDVSKAGDVEALATRAYDSFGAVHLLFNNAGVGTVNAATVWESSLDDWKWILDVNVWGVIHGIHFFVPRMRALQDESHIINTASIGGLISSSNLGIYKASKHAVVTITETLALELQREGSKIRASVLCPDWVKTRIFEADRNRPSELQHQGEKGPASDSFSRSMKQAILRGLSPSTVAEITFDAIEQNQFYIFTNDNIKKAIEARMNALLHQTMPPDLA